jgi:CheY-like chemotaxis protein
MERPAPKDVLLVENSPADIYLVQRAVADCGPAIRLSLLSSRSEVLPFLRHEFPFVAVPTPALILLDLGLPGRDGLDLLKEIRGRPEYQRTPVVVLSGSDRAVEEPRCLALGATAFVQKSLNVTDYFGSVQAIVQHWLGTDCSPP